MKDLSVSIGSVTLNNPVMTASGAFGNVKEATDLVDISKLGAVVPKTITRAPRQGNAPPRTVETTAGLLNAIGLDNDGLESFLTSKLPYYQSLPCPVVISFAGENADDYVSMAQSLELGIREWGIGNSNSPTAQSGNREWGIGNREWGIGNREWGIGNSDSPSANLKTTPYSLLPTPSPTAYCLLPTA